MDDQLNDSVWDFLSTRYEFPQLMSLDEYPVWRRQFEWFVRNTNMRWWKWIEHEY